MQNHGQPHHAAASSGPAPKQPPCSSLTALQPRVAAAPLATPRKTTACYRQVLHRQDERDGVLGKKEARTGHRGMVQVPILPPGLLSTATAALSTASGPEAEGKDYILLQRTAPSPKNSTSREAVGTANHQHTSAQKCINSKGVRTLGCAQCCTWPTPAGQPSIMMLAQTQQETGALMPALVPLAQKVCVLATVLFSGPSHYAVVGWSAEPHLPSSPAVSHTARVGRQAGSFGPTYKPLMGRQLLAASHGADGVQGAMLQPSLFCGRGRSNPSGGRSFFVGSASKAPD